MMSDGRLPVFLKTCSYLNDLIDNLTSENLPIDRNVLPASAELTQSLFKMSRRTNGKIVLIPEKLMAIFQRISAELGKNTVWYYCDLCYVDTTCLETWKNHVYEKNHYSHLPETLLTCSECGICLYGLEENIYAYISSPSHRLVDDAKSKQLIRVAPLNMPSTSDKPFIRGSSLNCLDSMSNKKKLTTPTVTKKVTSFSPWQLTEGSSHWKKIKKFAVLKISDDFLQVFDSIADAVNGFKFYSNNTHNFENFCSWIDSCFTSVSPCIRCDFCTGTRRFEYSIFNLWEHMTSSYHVEKISGVSEKKAILVCLDCKVIFINLLSHLRNHSHGSEFNIATETTTKKDINQTCNGLIDFLERNQGKNIIKDSLRGAEETFISNQINNNSVKSVVIEPFKVQTSNLLDDVNSATTDISLNSDDLSLLRSQNNDSTKQMSSFQKELWSTFMGVSSGFSMKSKADLNKAKGSLNASGNKPCIQHVKSPDLDDDEMDTWEKQLREKNLSKELVNVFNYISLRFKKEPFCHCCPTVYFCCECKFLCSYLDYWKAHLRSQKHINSAKGSNKYLLTDHCASCGLQVFIEKEMKTLLDSSPHIHLDNELDSLIFDQDSFFSNCSKVRISLQDSNKLFLRDDVAHLACRKGCKCHFEPTFMLRNFSPEYLDEMYYNFLKKHSNVFGSLKTKIKYICYLCKPAFVDFYPGLSFHLKAQHKEAFDDLPSICKVLPEACSRLAVLCYQCLHILVINEPQNFSTNDLLVPNITKCKHLNIKSILTTYIPSKPVTKNSKELGKLRSTSDEPCSASGEHKDLLSPILSDLCYKIMEPLSLIFTYLLSRYTKEPFCHECGTYFYCIACSYCTSYLMYWERHLSSETHKTSMKSFIKYEFVFHHCFSCGLTVFVEKNMIGLLDTDEHRKTDEILEIRFAEEGVFLANCKDMLPKLESRNARFLSKIDHSACKPNCNFKRIIQASNICEKQPFVIINFSLTKLKKSLKSYLNANNSVLKGKIKYTCLDCEPMSEEKISLLDTHLISEHPINSHRCHESRKCLRISVFCCVCNTLMISTCRKSIENILLVKGYDQCDHVKLLDTVYDSLADMDLSKKAVDLLSRLDQHIIDSGFKCTYLQNILTYHCVLCHISFKCIEDLCYHIALPAHVEIYEDMLIFFCYDCNSVNILNDSESYTTGVCFHFYKLHRLYQEVKKKSGSSPLKDNSNQLKTLPDITIKHEVKGEDSNHLTCPILTSHYEYYNINFLTPLDSGSTSSSIQLSVIYRDVSLSSVSHMKDYKLNNDSDIQYECLVCDMKLKNAEVFYTHLEETSHVYQCYFATQVKQIIPLMIFCENCSLFIISDDILNLEKHFTSKDHLANCRKIKISNSSLEDDELWSISNLSDSCLEKFNSKKTLSAAMNSIISEMQIASKFYSRVKDKLEQDILSVLIPVFPQAKVFCFGSRETGLAKKDSDVDVFVDLMEYYLDECKNVKKATGNLASLFRNNRKVFECRRLILETRVPLVKLWHRYLSINIDLNCLNSAGVENTKLLRFYLDFDGRIRWLVAVVKEWANMHHILGVRKGFNSYMLVWMVFFFLMQPNIAVLPTVLFLKSIYKGPKVVINGWDYSFSLNPKIVKANFKVSSRSANLLPHFLLKEFFKFYSNLNTDGVFLCPLTGNIQPVSAVQSPDNIYHDTLRIPVTVSGLKLNTPLVIVDPIILNFNITKNIHESLWKHFKILCVKMLINFKWLN